MIERKLEVKLTFIQTDDGTEFKLIVNELQKKGVLYRLTCPHISRKNGVVGCRHKRILKRGLSLLLATYMPLRY